MFPKVKNIILLIFICLIFKVKSEYRNISISYNFTCEGSCDHLFYNKLFYTNQNSNKSTISGELEFKELSNISVELERTTGPNFQLSGYFDLGFFKIYANSLANWNIQMLNEICPRLKFEDSNEALILDNSSDTLDTKCYLQSVMNFCKNHKSYQSIYLTKDVEYTFDDFFDIPDKGPEFKNLKISFIRLDKYIRVPLAVNSFEKSNESYINIYDNITFRIPTSARGYKENILLSLVDPNNDNFTYSECHYLLVVTGLNCHNATSDSSTCPSCVNGTYFREGTTDKCYKPEQMEHGYYFSEEENMFKKCYSSCQNCYGKGNEKYHNCSSCAYNYPLYSYIELNGNMTKNCYTNCSKSITHPYRVGDTFQCIDECWKITNYTTLEEDSLKCHLIDEVPNYYIYNDTLKTYYRNTNCYKLCEYCYDLGDESNHKCIKCIDGYTNVGGRCIEKCIEEKGYNGNFECINCKSKDLIKLNSSLFCLSPEQISRPYVIINELTNYAEYCYSLCNTCSKPPDMTLDEHYCTSCKGNFYLNGSDCIPDCSAANKIPINLDNGLNICENCKTYFDPPKYFNTTSKDCVDEVPEHFFISNFDTNVISECDIKCRTCEIKSTQCTGCTNKNSYYNTINNTCEDTCPDYLFLDKENMQCFNCKNNALINDTRIYKFYDKNECVDPPDTPYYIEDNDYNIIDYCDSKCAACTRGPSYYNSHCTKCKSQYYSMYQSDNCVEECPTGYILNEVEKMCINCHSLNKYRRENDTMCYDKPKYTYVYNAQFNIIRDCYETCETCNADGTPKEHNCITCREGYFLNMTTNKDCVKDCGDDRYIVDTINRTCLNCYFKVLYRLNNEQYCYMPTNKKKLYVSDFAFNIVKDCDGSCAACNGPEYCTECGAGYKYYYKSSKCVKSCGYLYGLTDDSKNCTNCTEFYKDHLFVYKEYALDTLCIEKPDEDHPFFYVDIYSNLITFCFYRCKTCDGAGTADFHNCTSCKDGYDTDGKNCLSCKDVGKVKYVNTTICIYAPNTPFYYVNEDEAIIDDCDSKCAACKYNSTWCTACYPGFYLKYGQGDCLTSCENYLYQDEEKRECVNCKDINYSYKPLTINTCISEDDIENYPHVMNDTTYNAIILCHERCETCFDGPTTTEMNCEKCISGYYLNYQTTNCIEKCDFNKYYVNEDERKCLSCHDENSYRFPSNLTSCPYDTITSKTFLFDNDYNVLKECGQTCKSCIKSPILDSSGNIVNDNCQTCEDDYYFTYDKTMNNQTCVKCGIIYGIPTHKDSYAMCQKCSERTDELNYKYNKENTPCVSLPNSDNTPTYLISDLYEYNVIEDCYLLCKTCNNTLEYITDASGNEQVKMNCLSCKTGYNLQDTNCMSTCPNEYMGLDSNGICVNCKDIGKVRYLDGVFCTEEPTDDFRYINYEYAVIDKFICEKDEFYDSIKNTCETNCTPVNFYVKDELLRKCVNCKDNNQFKFLLDDQCYYDSQPPHTFIEYTDYNILEYCHETCETCYGKNTSTTTNCITCSDGFYAQVDDPTNCLSYCEDSHIYGEDSVENKCVNCKDNNKYKFINDTKCTSESIRPSNTYYIYEDYHVIDYCETGCATCENDKDNCLSCMDGYYFAYNDSNRCVQCGILYGISDDNTRCEKCTDRIDGRNYKFDTGTKCIEKPDENKYTYYEMYPEYGVISLCYEGCKMCDRGPDLNESLHYCLGCKNGYVANGVNCEKICQNDTEVYDEDLQKCIVCSDYGQVQFDDKCIDKINDTGYFQIDDGVIGQCYYTCETCFGSPSIDGAVHNCSKCKEGYYLFGKNCDEDCPAYYVKNDDNRKCENCKDKNLYYFNDSCIDYIVSHYFFDENDPYNYYNYLTECDDVCQECNNSASYCTKCYKDSYFTYNKTTCVKTCDIYYGIDPNTNACINCRDIGLYKIVGINDDTCQDKTNEYYVIFDEYNVIRNKTYITDPIPAVKPDNFSCGDGLYFQPYLTLLTYHIQCLTTCPDNYAKYDANHSCINCKSINQFKCTNCDYCTGKTTQPSGTTLINKDFNVIDGCDGIPCNEKISDYLYYYKNYLDGNLNVSIYDKNKTAEKNKDIFSNMSFINFTKCEDYIKDKNNIDKDTNLIFYQLEKLTSDDQITNNFDFDVYNPNGTVLDLNKCRDVGGFEIELVIKNKSFLADNDIDLINQILANDNDDKKNNIYADLCDKAKNETLNNIDNTTSTNYRKAILDEFSNICGNNYCTLNYINTTSNKINCKCYEEEKEKDEGIKVIFTKKIKLLNLDVIRCYNILLDYKNYYKSKGSIVFLGLVFSQIVNIFVYIGMGGSNILKTKLINCANEMRGSAPPVKNKKNNTSTKSISRIVGQNNIINKRQKVDFNNDLLYIKNKYNSNNNISLNSKNLDDSKLGSINKYGDINRDLKNKIIEENFEKTIKSDTVQFWDELAFNLKNKIFVIYSLNVNDITNSTSIKITIMIICIEVNFLFNALLFNDSMKNKIEDNGNDALKFNSKMLNSLISSLITCFVFTIFKNIMGNVSDISKWIKINQFVTKDSIANNESLNIIKKNIGIKNGLFLFFASLLIVFFWYFILCFCSIYNTLDLLWIYLSFESLNVTMIIEMILAIIQTYAKRIALKCSSKKCFSFSKFLNYL